MLMIWVDSASGMIMFNGAGVFVINAGVSQHVDYRAIEL